MALWTNPKTSPTSVDTNIPKMETPDSKLAALIKGVEQQKSNVYLQMGETYAKLHPDDYDEPFADMMKMIDQANKKLAVYAIQRQRVKGVIVCPSCDHECPKDSRFCNLCGRKLPEMNMDSFVKCKVCGELVVKDLDSCLFCGSNLHAPAVEVLRCPRCQKTLERGTRFCQYCGEPIVQPAASNAAEQKSAPPSKRICPKCGVVLEEEGLLYCTECGTKL